MGRVWLTLAVGLWASVTAGNQLEGLSGKAKLDAVLAEISKAQAAVQTLAADFQQTKVSRLLKEPSVRKGVFYFQAPDQVRWEYRNPSETVVLVTAHAMVTYRPSERLAEKVELGRSQRKLFAFLSAGEPITNLSRHFSFALRDPGGEGDFVLILNPVTHQLKKRLHHVELVIERKSFLPVRVSYTESDGDTTTYEFSQIKINQPLPPNLFSLDLPPGVRVVELKLRGSE
uniref:Outer membrane lipoprotein carrier protein LolA n=1 Tax=uncultured prokaryote TaxID=198431 RepID=H5SKX4_9ZZZZ|nr:outer membrane lipoprotein carrier protein LolA [uncultured prokaryote]